MVLGKFTRFSLTARKTAGVWDVEGREYLDFAGGIAVLNTGHLHPKVVAAVEAQLKKLSHTCFQVLAYEPYLELCEIMNQKVPGNFAKKRCWSPQVLKRWKTR
ncbi:4-aminobutyrate aminotransferase [Escherichia coli]|uniref:4-aminobutyrate aminotransferase n=1 Tax=Escherichia coli TaxID=562 RepID=A0AAX2K7N5_ECOLX|nr:4-aminobutyrate aminotransferase [Escherichia coli]